MCFEKTSLPLPFDPPFCFHKKKKQKTASFWCRRRGSVSRLDGVRSSAALEPSPKAQFTTAPLRPPFCLHKKRSSKLLLFGAGGGGQSHASTAFGLPRLLSLHRRLNSLPLPFDPLSVSIKKEAVNCFFLVPAAGVEPARYCYHRILSPGRLPIPSRRQIY